MKGVFDAPPSVLARDAKDQITKMLNVAGFGLVVRQDGKELRDEDAVNTELRLEIFPTLYIVAIDGDKEIVPCFTGSSSLEAVTVADLVEKCVSEDSFMRGVSDVRLRWKAKERELKRKDSLIKLLSKPRKVL
jgi:hypothetical protein